ncbi:MAG: LytR/AlgR family response regulator transcription factor [Acidimicrobiia bacterium]
MSLRGDPAEGLAVLVVDDETPALNDLAYLLRQEPGISSVTTADGATEAFRSLRDGNFDAVFLDIRMPGLDGMELARILGRFSAPPGVVFVSAHESHAVEAFELEAVDFLLKPVRRERLARAVQRLAARQSAPAPTPEEPERVAVETGGSTRFVERDTILFVEASGDYVRLHTEQGRYLVRTPISALEEAWADAGFVRVHRRYLVALRHLTEMRARPGGGYVLVVGDQELPVSRRHSRDVRHLFGALPPGTKAP